MYSKYKMGVFKNSSLFVYKDNVGSCECLSNLWSSTWSLKLQKKIAPGSIPGSGRSPGEGIGYPLQYSWDSLLAQLVKNPPAMQETWVQSLGWEDPLEKGTTPCSSILAWRIPWTIQGCKESDTTEWLSFSLSHIAYSWSSRIYYKSWHWRLGGNMCIFNSKNT